MASYCRAVLRAEEQAKQKTGAYVTLSGLKSYDKGNYLIGLEDELVNRFHLEIQLTLTDRDFMLSISRGSYQVFMNSSGRIVRNRGDLTQRDQVKKE